MAAQRYGGAYLHSPGTGVGNADIKVERLTVEEGGILNGKINAAPSRKAAPAPAAPAESAKK